MRFKEDSMKRQLALLLVSSMILSCAACGKTPDVSETTTMITDTAETSDEIPGYKYELYATMTPEEIVVVNISDCSHEGGSDGNGSRD